MMMRVPVISSNAGGLSEVNIEGVSGYLFDVGNIEGMSKKSIQLLSNETILEKFKDNAQKEARKFDLNMIVGSYIEIYKLALVNQ
jgi:glycosyltransferase involved in cell wall biosynthesis